jgi:uncharacterized protein YegP (UPF0339 family)
MIRQILALVAVVALSLSTVACAASNDEAAASAETGSQDLAAKSAKFDVFEGSDGEYYFSFVAPNGEKMIQSEGYTTKAACQAGVDATIQNAPDTHNVDILESTDSQWYFTVKGNNGEIVATSEMYASKANAERGAKAVRDLTRIIRSGS